MIVKQAINEAIRNGWSVNRIEVKHANGKKVMKSEQVENEKVIKLDIFGGVGCCGIYQIEPKSKKVIYID